MHFFLSYAIKIFTIAATIREIFIVVVMEPRCIFDLSMYLAKCRFTPFISRNLSCMVLFYFLHLYFAPTPIFNPGIIIHQAENAWNSTNLYESCSVNSVFLHRLESPSRLRYVMCTGPEASIFISYAGAIAKFYNLTQMLLIAFSHHLFDPSSNLIATWKQMRRNK